MSHVTDTSREAEPGVGVAVAPVFPGIDELRSLHNALSRRLREEKDSDELWRDVMMFLGRARRTGRVLEADEDRAAAQAMLNVWMSTLCREGRDAPEAILEDFAFPPADDVHLAECPYPGLLPHVDPRYFVGRRDLVDKALEILRTRRFLTVVGPPGSGKTSLVRAGLVPMLDSGALPGSDRWRRLGPVRPGRDSLARLVRLARPDRAGEAQWVAEQVRKIRDNPRHLTDLLAEVSDAPALLVVDPLERAFTVGARDASAFAAALSAMTESDGPRHAVVIVLRRDDLVRARALPPIEGAFRDAQLTVSPPTEDQLCQMIEQPARLVGLKFEQGVVDRLVDDVAGEPWSLPLLQFALTRLWDAREGSRITWRSYRQSLGPVGAFSAPEYRAESVYNELQPHEKLVAQNLFKRLVRPREGRSVTLTRATADDLRKASIPGVHAADVAARLAEAGLLRRSIGRDGRERFALAHELLVDHWPRLAEWVQESRIDRERLRYRLIGLGLAAVATSMAILAAVAWCAQRAAVESFQVARTRQIATRALAHRPIDQALLLAREAYPLATSLRKDLPSHPWIPEGRIALLYTFNRSPLLDRFLLPDHLTAEALGAVDRGTTVTIAAASPDGKTVASAGHHPGLGHAVFLRTVDRPARAVNLPGNAGGAGHRSDVLALSFSPDGKTLATGGASRQPWGGEVHLWDVSDPVKPRHLVAITPEPSQGGAARLTAPVVRLAFGTAGKDGRLRLALATPSRFDEKTRVWESGAVELWRVEIDRAAGRASVDLAGRSERGHFSPGVKEPALALAFSGDGTILAAGGGDRESGLLADGHLRGGKVFIWDVARFPETPPGTIDLIPRGQFSTAASALAFHPEGDVLAIGTLGLSLALVDLKDLKRIGHYYGHQGPVRALCFSPDGKTLASGGSETTVGLTRFDDVRKWLESGERPVGRIPRLMQGHLGDVQSLVFVRDGSSGQDEDLLMSTGQDEMLIRWRPTGRHPLAERVVETACPLNCLAVAPDGTVAVAPDVTGATGNGIPPAGDPRLGPGEANGPPRRYPILLRDADGRSPRELAGTGPGHTAPVRALAFHPREGHLVSVGEDRRVILWDVATGRPRHTDAAAHSATVNAVAWSPDGGRFATCGDDGRVLLWNADGRLEATVCRDESSPPVPADALAWAPDGKTLASGHRDRSIRLWDLSRPTVPRARGAPLYGHADAVTGLAFCPVIDKPWLASSGRDKVVLLWDLAAAGGPRYGPRLVRHSRAVLGLQFSEDGRLLASVSEDEESNVVLWNVPDRIGQQPIGSALTGHQGAVRALAFFPKGSPRSTSGSERMATAGEDRTLTLWQTSGADWVDAARRIANRELNSDEWESLLGDPYVPVAGPR